MQDLKPNRGAENPYLSLPLSQLRERKLRLEAELNDVKAIVAEVDAAIHEKVADEVLATRSYEKKFEGTVRVIIDGVEVVSNVPKRVSWDSGLLEEIIPELEAEGINPMQFIEYKCNVPERKYKEAPAKVRMLLDRARTMKHGAETIKLEEPSDD